MGNTIHGFTTPCRDVRAHARGRTALTPIPLTVADDRILWEAFPKYEEDMDLGKAPLGSPSPKSPIS